MTTSPRRDLAFKGGYPGVIRRKPVRRECGVQIVDTRTGDIAQWVRLEGAVTELFDVTVIPGVRSPTATGFLTNDIHTMVTIES